MRVVSLAPSCTEILFALGLGDKIVGVTRFCDYPNEAKKIHKVGGWLDNDFEDIIKLRPDLVFTSTFLQDKTVSKLKKLGIKVVHSDPKTLEDVFDSIRKIGEAVNKMKEAEHIVSVMKIKIKKVAEPYYLDKKPKIYIEEWHKPPTASGNWVPDMVKLAGGKSFARAGKISAKVDLKKLKKFNPDVVIISWCAFGLRARKEDLTKREGWNSLKAVKEGKIYVVDDNLLNRPGPRLAEGVKVLAEIMHK
ncbi:MAG TPA: cobalamin-binding protein [Candidatus Nanoarchaeia archaeon]|nr:cobalamin-binding protein [Candidatus Nanoarchaeia archaeon]